MLSDIEDKVPVDERKIVLCRYSGGRKHRLISIPETSTEMEKEHVENSTVAYLIACSLDYHEHEDLCKSKYGWENSFGEPA
jgi:hypothetical protein